jgi:hypothetical protein
VDVVAADHQLDMLERHVGAEPVRTVEVGAGAVLRLAGGLEGVEGREMRLADEAGAVAAAAELAGEAGGADRVVEVDAVVPDTVRARQEPGEDAGAGRLADDVGRDAGRKARPVLGEPVEMRRLDPPSLEPEAVAALLV